jgi:small subunit ribosomal protein S4
MVNGCKVNIPSYLIKPGDIITWRERSTETELYKKACEEIEDKLVPNWLRLDRENLSGQVLSLPIREEMDAKFDEKAIVEYYSR